MEGSSSQQNHPIENLMNTAMSSIREMVDVNTIIGEPIETTETNDESTSDTVDDIKAKITAIQKSLNPMEKTKAKAALTENNLPLAIKSITFT